MSKLSDTTSQVAKDLQGFQTFSKSILAINAASAATVKTTSAITYSNNGVMLTKAALAAQSIVPTHFLNGKMPVTAGQIQPINTTSYLTLSLDGAGVVSVSQGSWLGQNLSQLNLGTSAVGDGQIPDVPANFTPFGVIKIVTNGAATFQPGVTALDAAGVTATYYDVNCLPSGTL